MKFKTFLLQENSTITFSDVVKLIARDCKPFLDESEDTPMFRGMNFKKAGSNGLDVLKHEIRNNPHPEFRKPRDSSTTFNIMFNAMIECAFNVKDVRTRTVFVTGNHEDAGGYGSQHVVFPIGKIKYIWSPQIHDSACNGGWVKTLAINGSSPDLKLSQSSIRLMWDHMDDIEDPLFASKWVKGGKNIIDETQTTYYWDKDFHESKEPVYPLIKNGMKLYGEHFYKNNERLSDALTSNNEIFIYESDGYYSIPLSIVLSEYHKSHGTKNRAEWSELYRFILEQIDSI